MSGSEFREWDRLSDVEIEADRPEAGKDDGGVTAGIPRTALLAAALGDLVLMVGLTTALVGTIAFKGFYIEIRVLPWAVLVAWLWWLSAGAATLKILRATPGMLLAGLALSDSVSWRQLILALTVMSFSAALLGLPLLGGSSFNSILSRALGLSVLRRSSV